MNKLDNTEREQGDNIIMPVEQVERIKQNAILAGIPDQEVRKMSYKGLITLDESLRNALDDTVLITTTIEKSKRNSATEITDDERDNVERVRIVDNKQDHVQVIKQKKRVIIKITLFPFTILLLYRLTNILYLLYCY